MGIRGIHGFVWVYTLYCRGVHRYIMGIHGSHDVGI